MNLTYHNVFEKIEDAISSLPYLHFSFLSPLGKSMTLQLLKFKSLLLKDTLWHVLLKFAHWFLRNITNILQTNFDQKWSLVVSAWVRYKVKAYFVIGRKTFVIGRKTYTFCFLFFSFQKHLSKVYCFKKLQKEINVLVKYIK